jgi:hypothetical protein
MRKSRFPISLENPKAHQMKMNRMQHADALQEGVVRNPPDLHVAKPDSKVFGKGYSFA